MAAAVVQNGIGEDAESALLLGHKMNVVGDNHDDHKTTASLVNGSVEMNGVAISSDHTKNNGNFNKLSFAKNNSQMNAPAVGNGDITDVSTTRQNELTNDMITAKSRFGFTVKFDHEFPEKARPFDRPRLKHVMPLLALTMRYFRAWFQLKRKGIRMYIDNIELVNWKPIFGVPIGGIGSGSIGRGFRGEFCRFHMIPGVYKHHIVTADQFIVCIRKDNKVVYQRVLSTHKFSGRALRFVL